MLTDEKSAWGADIYIDVSKEVPGTKMETHFRHIPDQSF